ncbi:MAG: class I SAM-dependent methyltransferase, partial [Oscillospiraceae bacterium]|nr:class I SAM-dependent methyltransferase [Oscillospiraceae bacterium]
MKEHEQERLDRIADDNNYNQGINKRIIRYTATLFKRYMKQGPVLEMGPAHGLATDLLYPSFPDYSVVDASKLFIELIQERHPNVKTYVSLFEEFNPEKKYDNILIGHVLEHVEDPVAILKRCKEWKTEDGVILAAVPNSGSLHRLAGVKLGLIKDVAELNESDLKVGHRRVYN